MTGSILANEYVTDTMGLVLRLEQRRMGVQAQAIFAAADKGQTLIYIPAMVLAEMLYLSEKGRISLTLADIATHQQNFLTYRDWPMSRTVLEAAAEITDIRELHDRLIAATARSLKAALITNDPVIQSSAFVKTVW